MFVIGISLKIFVISRNDDEPKERSDGTMHNGIKMVKTTASLRIQHKKRCPRSLIVLLWYLELLALTQTCGAFTPTKTTARRCSPSPPRSFTHFSAIDQSFVEPDYLITDCIDIENRPTFLDTARRPSILLRMLLLTFGSGISFANIVGNYNDFTFLEATVIPLGFLTAIVDYVASRPPYYASPNESVSPNVRTGTADDAVIHLYAAIYTAGATWLALRVGPYCSSWLTLLDPLCGLSAAGIFLFSLLAPILTLLHDAEIFNAETPLRQMVSVARLGQVSQNESLVNLSETELLRAKSLIAVGFVGVVFAPIAIKFAIAGEGWWLRVLEAFPAQGTLESSTALFGVFATQASMVAHTFAKAGVAPFRTVAPAFAVVCFILAIVPCICALYWLGDDISFFSLYTM